MKLVLGNGGCTLLFGWLAGLPYSEMTLCGGGSDFLALHPLETTLQCVAKKECARVTVALMRYMLQVNF